MPVRRQADQAGGFLQGSDSAPVSRNGRRRVNAKSIMGVMMLAAGMGSEIEIETDGVDEQAAMDALASRSSTTSSAKGNSRPASRSALACATLSA
jgi:phosphotransferase system HPr (HPr) family protein